MAAIVPILAIGLVMVVLLRLALNYGSTRISVLPAGGCVCPDAQPPAGELTTSIAATFHTKHRYCPGCPVQRETGEILAAAL